MNRWTVWFLSKLVWTPSEHGNMVEQINVRRLISKTWNSLMCPEEFKKTSEVSLTKRNLPCSQHTKKKCCSSLQGERGGPPLVCFFPCQSSVLLFAAVGKCVWVCACHAALQLPCSLKRWGAGLTLTRFPGIYFDQVGSPTFIAVSRLRVLCPGY